MISINKGSNYIRLLSDLCCIIISFFMATFFSLRGVESLDWYLLLFLTVTWAFSSRITNLYDEFRTAKFVDEFVLLIPNVLLQFMGVIFLLFTFNEHRYQRTFAYLFPVVLFVLLTIKKYLFKIVMLELRKRGRNTKRIIILGAGNTGMSFWEMIKANPQFGYKV